MLYDVTNEDSVSDLYDWINVISSVPNSPKTKILIEAKTDLKRNVTKEESQQIYDKFDFQGEIIETSAKTGKNVEKAFETLGREILKNSLQRCSNCEKMYPIELKFCQYCGSKTI